jgi:predicted metal-dependent HD superfamily phosphohydrolase
MKMLEQYWHHAWSLIQTNSNSLSAQPRELELVCTSARIDITPSPELFAELINSYSEPHRFYHTLQHLGECLNLLDTATHFAEHLAEIQIALWFHDAIYDTHARDNEVQSADWAHRSLVTAGANAEIALRVHDLILATKHDVIPVGTDAQLLVDVDLAILGADELRFAEYERQVRQEYCWVPEVAFQEGRSRILQSFLDRPTIYSTTWFVDRLEAQARRNLWRSIEMLNKQEYP